jgi:hypothetical protein
MPSDNSQPSSYADKVHRGANSKGAIVEENMVVGAKTKQVSEVIGSIMGPSQRTNVCGLGVWTAGAIQSNPAHLTVVVVQAFHFAAQCSVTNDALNIYGSTSRRSAGSRLGQDQAFGSIRY